MFKVAWTLCTFFNSEDLVNPNRFGFLQLTLDDTI